MASSAWLDICQVYMRVHRSFSGYDAVHKITVHDMFFWIFNQDLVNAVVKYMAIAMLTLMVIQQKFLQYVICDSISIGNLLLNFIFKDTSHKTDVNSWK